MSSLHEVMAAKDAHWTAAELIEANRCSAQCLCASTAPSAEKCSCVCRGRFHGSLSATEVIEPARFLTLTRMSEVNIKYLYDDDKVYAWDTRRATILAEGSTSEEARADLERLTTAADDALIPDDVYVFSNSIEA